MSEKYQLFVEDLTYAQLEALSELCDILRDIHEDDDDLPKASMNAINKLSVAVDDLIYDSDIDTSFDEE